MPILRYAMLWAFSPLFQSAHAQQSFEIMLPDAQVVADRLQRGDGDTYGLGDWHCTFNVALEGTELVVDGQIVFSEKANDYTTIVGAYHRRISVGELERCRHCWVTLEEFKGSVGGPNIGARGYQWFTGRGLIRRAKIQTDTFGDDVGRIGGTIQFVPIKVLVDCAIAGVATFELELSKSLELSESLEANSTHVHPLPHPLPHCGKCPAHRAALRTNDCAQP